MSRPLVCLTKGKIGAWSEKKASFCFLMTHCRVDKKQVGMKRKIKAGDAAEFGSSRQSNQRSREVCRSASAVTSATSPVFVPQSDLSCRSRQNLESEEHGVGSL